MDISVNEDNPASLTDVPVLIIKDAYFEKDSPWTKTKLSAVFNAGETFPAS